MFDPEIRLEHDTALNGYRWKLVLHPEHFLGGQIQAMDNRCERCLSEENVGLPHTKHVL